jgi:hypothetical protein
VLRVNASFIKVTHRKIMLKELLYVTTPVVAPMNAARGSEQKHGRPQLRLLIG